MSFSSCGAVKQSLAAFHQCLRPDRSLFPNQQRIYYQQLVPWATERPHRYLKPGAVTCSCHIDEVLIDPGLLVIAGQQILLAFIETEPKHSLD